MTLVCKNEEEMFLETGNLDRCYILQLEGEWQVQNMTEGEALEVGRRNKIAMLEAKKLLYVLCMWLRPMVSCLTQILSTGSSCNGPELNNTPYLFSVTPSLLPDPIIDLPTEGQSSVSRVDLHYFMVIYKND